MSTSWNMGYNTDLQYTYGYYRELNPLYDSFLFLTQGLEFPKMKGGYACELGFGQGVSIAIHALASDTEWAGTDFNPEHANFARHLTDGSSIRINLQDNAFDEFARRDDLPMFDYICLHGIWTWISRENQDEIIRFVRDRLNVGGVLYVSYNVSPGFMVFEPVRHMMKEFTTHVIAEDIPAEQKMREIRDFLKKIMDAKPALATVMPGLSERINNTLDKDYHYLSGEYLNTYWDITHFSEMAKRLDAGKVTFACSATLSELVDELNLSKEQLAAIEPFRNTQMYETCRDFMVNQQFRRDFFVKGVRKMSAEQKKERLDDFCFILTTPIENANYSFKARIGTANLKKEIYEPIFNLMADYKVRSFREIREALSDNKALANYGTLYDAVIMLVSSGQMSPALREGEISDEIRQRCRLFNERVLHNRILGNINYLASPVIGGGVFVSDLTRRFAGICLKENAHDADSLTAAVLKDFARTGTALDNADGKPMSDEEKHNLVREAADNLLRNVIPLYKALMII